jgi:choline dehydrogenase-like flavoprotein
VGDTMTDFDAIVVGSGISGGWAAKELTEAGLRTLVLERGRNVEHVKDYPTAMLDPWQLPHGNRPTTEDLEQYYVQKDLYLFGQDSKHFLVKDTDHPYNAIKDFRWFHGYQVGGRSLVWARHCFRWSDLDFEANQCHDAANVFVTDGACMGSTACQNPSLTYMALTARACAYAVDQLKRGEL